MVYFITMKGDTVTKKLNKPQHEIIMIFTAFVLLTAATILSIINDNDIPTIIPFHTITVPIINGLSAFACFILFFIKTNIDGYKAVADAINIKIEETFAL